MVNGINVNSYGNYGIVGGYKTSEQNSQAGAGRATEQSGIAGFNGKVENNGITAIGEEEKNTTAEVECQTCKNRKYQDGSNENVSYKSATHISPEAAGSAVRAHEGEHVSNAYTKAAQKGGKVVNASVTMHTAICPECGRTYVSGGTTNTTIKYANEENPYVRDKKLQDSTVYTGQNMDVDLR